jgi:hypothetical protein
LEKFLRKSVQFRAQAWYVVSVSYHCPPPAALTGLKGLSHEIDFKNVDENGQILALLRAAAGF